MFPPIPLFHVKASFFNILCTIPNLTQGSVLKSGFYQKPTFSCLWQQSPMRGQALCTYSLGFLFHFHCRSYHFQIYPLLCTPNTSTHCPTTPHILATRRTCFYRSVCLGELKNVRQDIFSFLLLRFSMGSAP